MSSQPNPAKKAINLLQEFSVPLILGVVVSVIMANYNNDLYVKLITTPVYQLHHVFDHEQVDPSELPHALESSAVGGQGDRPDAEGGHGAGEGHGGMGHYFTLHFLIDDIFMVFFFGIAAKEITESCMPGGALNPVSKAINPLLGTLGGVLGPVLCFFIFNAAFGAVEFAKGWGIPTATDIALAWLVARLIFGSGHPGISFLLLLAVADDAIGLVIIAIFYPDPYNPTVWGNTWWILPGMAVAFLLRKKRIKAWWPYIFLGGLPSWWGLYSAHLHPALALVPIVPFLPGPNKDTGLFTEETDYDEIDNHAKQTGAHGHTPLENFEHDLKIFVDFGLFFFAFANAGVPFASINNLTWIIFFSLLFGKAVGIFGFSMVGVKVGFPLPDGMNPKHLLVAGIIAGIGLTVALFVCGQAFTDPVIKGAAKMGALFSAFSAFIAWIAARLIKLNRT